MMIGPCRFLLFALHIDQVAQAEIPRDNRNETYLKLVTLPSLRYMVEYHQDGPSE
jgi:hypothetical protein